LAAQLALHEPIAGDRNTAIWGYYRRALREAGNQQGATLLFRTRQRRAWFWYVPLPDNLVNVGVVGDLRAAVISPNQVAETFEEELVDCPAVAERLIQAELISPLRAARNLSFRSRQAAGPNWILCGDALAGVDPLLCAGVMLALRSGQLAGDSAIAALSADRSLADVAAAGLAQLETAVDRLRRLTRRLHSPDLALATFIARHPHCEASLLRLLQGDLMSDEDDATLTELESGSAPAFADAAS
jgi:flavin-dependent dehydrogenase